MALAPPAGTTRRQQGQLPAACEPRLPALQAETEAGLASQSQCCRQPGRLSTAREVQCATCRQGRGSLEPDCQRRRQPGRQPAARELQCTPVQAGRRAALKRAAPPWKQRQALRGATSLYMAQKYSRLLPPRAPAWQHWALPTAPAACSGAGKPHAGAAPSRGKHAPAKPLHSRLRSTSLSSASEPAGCKTPL